MRRAWLQSRDWEFVVAMNAGLCETGHALHKPTTDGYEETKILWTENYRNEMTLTEAVDLCRRCHRLAPFCNFNGNTFMAIIRDCIAHIPGLSFTQIALVKSLAGHMVAGTAEPEEITQFHQLLRDIEEGSRTKQEEVPVTFSVGDRVQTLKGTLTGIITEIGDHGAMKWKCDQNGAVTTATAASLRLYNPKSD